MEEEKFSELINNFKKIVNSNDSTQSHLSSNDFNNSHLNITPEMISNLTNLFNNSKQESIPDNNKKTEKNSDDFANNVDLETILKFKSIIDKMNNKNDPRTKLLYSLKPYLRESRRKKLDQYVNLLKFTSISEIFQNGKGR